MKLVKCAYIPDAHVPYHSQGAVDVMLKWLEYSHGNKPYDYIIVLGDFFDFNGFKTHKKTTREMNADIKTIQEELETGAAILQEIRTIVGKRTTIYFIEGNHEDRLNRYVADKCPELLNMLDVRSMVDTPKLNLQFYPYATKQTIRVPYTKIFVSHAGLSGAKNFADTNIIKGFETLVTGHTHRMQFIRTKSLGGREIHSISPGWLGDGTHPIFDYKKNLDQWTHGILESHTIDKVNYFDLIPISNGKIYKSGVYLEA